MSRRNRILLLLAAVIVIDVIAFFVVPPYDPLAAEGVDAECVYPICFINGNLELPAPHVVIPPGHHTPPGLVVFDVSISSTLLTLWIVAVVVILSFWLMTRKATMIPSKRQNVAEWIFETLENFAMSLGGPGAKPYIPLFAAFFLLILFSNWSGLIPGVGRVIWFRAPTSDVNVTIGLALVAFFFFQYQGFKHLGMGYLGKFFPIFEFKKGIGAGLIAMFVGLVELLLEFVKPSHAVDATLRQHLRRRGGARRPHGADDRVHPPRHVRARGHAEPRPGAHLQHAHAHVHPGGHRAPR